MNIHSQFEIYINDFNNPFPIAIKLEDPNWIKTIAQFIIDFENDSDIFSVNTSGSTGKPKSILISKQKMRASAQMTGNFLGLSNGNSALLCLPASYIAGKMMIVRAMVLGLKLVCVQPTTKLTINRPFDFCAMVPLQALSNLESLDRIDKIIIGGGAISKIGQDQLLNLKHEGIFQTYGMTETLSHIALKPLKDPYYRVFDGIDISKSKNNCLIIHAPSLNENDVVTNDIVEIIDHKTFEFIGRTDNVINTGGVKIHPEQIEKILSDQIDKPFFVYGVADERLGQKVILCIEGVIKENLDIDFDQLSKFEKPKDIWYIHQFLRTETNKIRRKDTIQASLNREE